MKELPFSKEEKKHAQELDMSALEDMVFDGVVETVDGCSVEPDGVCPHGKNSPLLVLGII